MHHVALVVKDIEAVLGDYSDILGLPRTRVVSLDAQGVKATLIPVGDVEIELLEPTDPEGGVARFLERRGESMHHICFQVDDVDQELKALEARGLQLLNRESRPGLAGKVGFIHPRSTQGTLVELCSPLDHGR